MRSSIVPDLGSGPAAGASLAAGIIHFAVTPDHMNEWWGYGAFFVALASFQLVWAVLVLRPTRFVTGVGIAVNGAAIVVWSASRMTGLGIGPDGARAHSVGWPDLAIVVVELVVVAESARLMTRRDRPRRPARTGTTWLGVALVVAGTALTASAVAAAAVAPEHDHSHGPGHGPSHDPSHGTSHGTSHGPGHDPGHDPGPPPSGQRTPAAAEDEPPAEHAHEATDHHSH